MAVYWFCKSKTLPTASDSNYIASSSSSTSAFTSANLLVVSSNSRSADCISLPGPRRSFSSFFCNGPCVTRDQDELLWGRERLFRQVISISGFPPQQVPLNNLFLMNIRNTLRNNRVAWDFSYAMIPVVAMLYQLEDDVVNLVQKGTETADRVTEAVTLLLPGMWWLSWTNYICNSNASPLLGLSVVAVHKNRMWLKSGVKTFFKKGTE